jgi:hypothetical protein
VSAALQLPLLWANQAANAQEALSPLQQVAPSLRAPGPRATRPRPLESTIHHLQKKLPPSPEAQLEPPESTEPVITYAFYRKHTEKLLRRYLYASMQIGRSPCLLSESVDRGWASSRRVRTFEDALIFVLDVERCLKRLSRVDQQLISRVVFQEYTQNEAAGLLGISVRTVCAKLPQALDRLTESLVKADLLILPS